MTQLKSAAWWKAASVRALRTALVIAIPYVPASAVSGVPYVTILLAAALAVVLSFLTSLAGLAEVSGEKQPWFFAVFTRVVKTVAQAVVAGIGAAVLITEVDWTSIWQLAITSGFGTLLIAVLSHLPEAPEPLAATTIETTTTTPDGGVVVTEVPVVASVEAASVDTTPPAEGLERETYHI